MEYAINRFDQAAALLPARWQRLARQLPDHQKSRAEEFRLRAGQTMTVLLPEGEVWCSDELPRPIVTQTDLEQLCDSVTGYSRYAYTQTLRQGYLTAAGGFRIGVCGAAVIQDGVNTNLRDLSSATIRIGRQKRGLAAPLVPQLYRDGHICSTLIIAPPGVGKTTLLRDLICQISNGTEEFSAHRVSVVDERGEIAVMYRGIPQMEVGCHTDVLDACPKAIGISMLLRSANPEVIAVDEITEERDLQAIFAAANCGVCLLATIHAASCEELMRKPLYTQMLQMKVFEKLITIDCRNGTHHYRVEDLQ